MAQAGTTVEEKAKTVLRKVRQRTIEDVDRDLTAYWTLRSLGKARGEERVTPGRVEILLEERERLRKAKQ